MIEETKYGQKIKIKSSREFLLLATGFSLASSCMCPRKAPRQAVRELAFKYNSQLN